MIISDCLDHCSVCSDPHTCTQCNVGYYTLDGQQCLRKNFTF